MVAGAIPVFFWKRTAYYQYEWFLPGEPASYSVYIDRNAVKNGTASIKEVLGRFSAAEVREMREKVIDSIPKFVYGNGGGLRDAFDVAIEGVMRRFKEQEGWGYKWK
ncbi:xyloglucan galactosyltransferase XLT2-like [Momordica charantia]|uniref:Xyloglucan galactosyltransferase XLT2-like n=1 Tax=Momordica charantia TaxID=3673 RepID=A0A6J1E4C9_MOMCH|nr:xyloglucan galactosyltransferase XLT2-like [Momordica charantia]